MHNEPKGSAGAVHSVQSDHSVRISKPHMSTLKVDNVLANTNPQPLDSHFHQPSHGPGTSASPLVADPLGHTLPHGSGLGLSHQNAPSIHDISSTAAVRPAHRGMRPAVHITHPQVASDDSMDTSAAGDITVISAPSSSGTTTSSVRALMLPYTTGA